MLTAYDVNRYLLQFLQVHDASYSCPSDIKLIFRKDDNFFNSVLPPMSYYLVPVMTHTACVKVFSIFESQFLLLEYMRLSTEYLIKVLDEIYAN
jgi:hypothetical protein